MKKKIIIIAAIIAALAIAGVCIFLFFGKSETAPKKVKVNVETKYSELIQKDTVTAAEVDKALKEYEKSESGDKIVYTKDNKTVKVQTAPDGEVTYISYSVDLSDKEEVKLNSDFNESYIHIGDEEEAVLETVKNEEFIYHLRTTNDDGEPLEIFYYGWHNREAIIELVFTDGKLSYYTLNSSAVANPATADNIFEKNSDK